MLVYEEVWTLEIRKLKIRRKKKRLLQHKLRFCILVSLTEIQEITFVNKTTKKSKLLCFFLGSA